jgi:dihydrofolate synthase / folylpolyglutamate synthase
MPHAFRTPLDDALDYLKTFTDWEQKLPPDASKSFDLARVARLLAKLGDPHLGRAQIHVTGTKGKGSVVHFADAVLRAHGVRTFRFVSPHVERINERIAIDGADLSDERFAAAVLAVRPAIDALARETPDDPPTFFEVLTAAGFAAAREARVDADVLEVGLGGRLDATNVVDPTVCVITSIDLDHVRILGDTRDKIAAEKAGIVKPGRPVLAGLRTGDEGLEVILARARSQKAPISHVGAGIEVATRGFAKLATGRPGVRFGGAVDGIVLDSATAPGGVHQAANAVLAIGAAAKVLDALGRPLDLARATGAIEAASLPARAEAFQTWGPEVLLDGAHTSRSCEALAELATWWSEGRRVVLLGGLTADRSPREVFMPFRLLCERAVFTPIPSPRSAAPEAVAREWSALGGVAETRPTARQGLNAAMRMAGPRGAVVTAGSFYLAGEIRPILRALS